MSRQELRIFSPDQEGAAPAAKEPRGSVPAPSPELEAILHAWNEATVRLSRTHEMLRQEVHRLTDELEAKNRELARKDRLADLGQMASHIAHEVRNSLVPMKLYLSLLRRRIDADAGSLDVLDKISAGFTALETTVNDLLHFSADREPQLTCVEIPDLVREVLHSLAPQLEAQRIITHVDAAPGMVAQVDREMLRRAMINLVLNALDAMSHGGELVITACHVHDGVEIEVADSGPGIEEAAMGRLFEPFFTTKGTGTGLGLAIVERIAEAHGGSVLAANCPEGGAAFTIRIPDCTVSSSWRNAA